MKPFPYHINNPGNRIPESLTTKILNESRSLEYHSSLPDYVPTPVICLDNLAEKYGVGKIFVKDESKRFGLKAFKGLGASYAIHMVLEKNPEITTICTATEGNHGRAVAWAARQAGRKAMVYVPRDASSLRIGAIEKEGAIVEKLDMNYDQSCLYAEKMSKENGWQLVQDTAWNDYFEIPAFIMAGYLTHFHELEDNLHSLPEPGIDFVFLQAGTGSWAASACWYYLNRYGKNRPKLIIVEPVEAACMLESFVAGARTYAKGRLETIMAGLNCGIPSSSGWEIIKVSADTSMMVEDEFAREAIRTLYKPEDNDRQIISGESGACGLAGFIALMTDQRYIELKKSLNINGNSRILFYSTEGDTDKAAFEEIINR